MHSLILGWAAAAALARGGAEAPRTDWPVVEQRAALLRDRATAGSRAYSILSSLTTEIGPRLEGSEGQHRAARWAVAELEALGFENIRLETFAVDGWTRGEERAEVVSPASQRLLVTALGNSSATPSAGIEAEIALFHTYADFLAQPPNSLRGKIAVVTQPMAQSLNGAGYGVLAEMRTRGPLEAAKRGAVAYMHRSLGTGALRAPHTGGSKAAGIPAVALASPDAEQLERLVATGQPVRVRLVSTPSVRKGATADTVMGDIRGRLKPDDVVLIGAHLDSWDLGTGALDDGAGVAISIAAAKLIAEMPERPLRTIRVVLFGAEELGFSGAAYAKAHAAQEGARYVIASESDSGAEPVYKIALPASAAASPYGRTLGNVLAPLKIYIDDEPVQGNDPGADLEPLIGVPQAFLAQDGTHYFDFHHSPDDTLDKVDPHRLDAAAAAWAVFAYLAADTDVDFRTMQPGS